MAMRLEQLNAVRTGLDKAARHPLLPHEVGTTLAQLSVLLAMMFEETVALRAEVESLKGAKG